VEALCGRSSRTPSGTALITIVPKDIVETIINLFHLDEATGSLTPNLDFIYLKEWI
jgi:hypothetical protein